MRPERPAHYTFAVAVTALALWIVAGHAQSGARVTVTQARIRVQPDASSPVVATVGAGTLFENATVRGDWVEVVLPPDGSGFRRVGYIKTDLLDISGLAPTSPPRPAQTSPAAESVARPAPTETPSAAATTTASTRPTVAVLDLDFSAIKRWWDWNWDVGEGIGSLLVNQLVIDRTYRVIERKELATILAEQNFSNGDRADPGAKLVSQLRKVLGAQYILVGNVTQFSVERKGFRIGGWINVPIAGNAGIDRYKSSVNLSLRMINTSTSEVQAVALGKGLSERRGLAVGGGTSGANGSVSMNSSGFRESVLGEATQQAVDSAITQLAAARGSLNN